MGATGSKVATKIANSFSFSGVEEGDEHHLLPDGIDRGALARIPGGGTPFVFKRRG